MLRGLSTVTFYSPDLASAKRWYTDLFDVAPYLDTPAYLEWRIGDYQHEFGVVDSSYATSELSRTADPGIVGQPSGAVVYWHVDDVPSLLARLAEMGAKVHDAPRDRGTGFITASVLDPWGNVLGLMYNPHYLAVRKEVTGK